MEPLAKILLLAGSVLFLAGGLLWVLAKLHFRGLPGDIVYHGDRTTFYFPLATCLFLSLLGTLALWLWQWISRR
jgi:DUF2905 family protein